MHKDRTTTSAHSAPKLKTFKEKKLYIKRLVIFLNNGEGITMAKTSVKVQKTSKGKGYPLLLQQRMNVAVTVFVVFMLSAYNAIVTKGYMNYEGVRYMAFRLGLLLALLALLVIWIVYRNTQPKWAIKSIQECVGNVKKWEWALLLYLAVAFLSTLASEYQHYAFIGTSTRNEGFLMLLCYGLTFFVISRFYKPKKWAFYVFTITCAILASYGILQYFGIDPLGLGFRDYTMKYYIAFYSTLSNTNAASALLTLCLMISAVLFIQGEEDKKSWIFFFCSLVVWTVLCMGETDSGLVGLMGAAVLTFPLIVKNNKTLHRGLLFLGCVALIRWMYHAIKNTVLQQETGGLASQIKSPFLWAGIVCIGAAILLYFSRNKMQKNIFGKNWRKIWWIAMAVCMVLGVILLPILANYTSNVAINEVASILRGNIQPEMGSYRIYVWEKALEIYKSYPILGVGPDGFYPTFINLYQEESMAFSHMVFDKVHSEYLQTLVDMGPIALAALLGFYVLLLKNAWKYKEDPLVLAVATALICFMIQAVFNFSQPISTPVVWVMWGILGALVLGKSRAREQL